MTENPNPVLAVAHAIAFQAAAMEDELVFSDIVVDVGRTIGGDPCVGVDIGDTHISLRDAGQLAVQIAHESPELGDVHEMRFDMASAEHAPEVVARQILKVIS